MRRRLAPWALSVALAGCSSSLQVDWASDDLLVAPPKEAHEGHGAVILIDELKVRIVEQPRDLYQERAIHRATAVLTEDGLDVGDIEIVYPRKGKIQSFEARTIAADGTVAEVEPTKVFDEASKDKEGYSVRTASLPRVSVGSIVEYRAVIRYPNPYSSDWDTISSKYPIEKYRVDFRGPNSFRWKAQAYNFPEGSQGWRVGSQGRSWTLSIELDDVPAWEHEDYDPHGWDTEPRWAFIIRQYLDGTEVNNWNYDWKYALDHRGKQLYWDDKDYYEGFDPEVDVSACAADIECKIQRGLDWLNARVEVLNFGDWPGRPAREVLDAKTGYGYERNRMLHRILDELDVDSQFVFGRTRHNGSIDRNLPYPGAMNHLMLYVPEQEGLAEGFFVDATCEWCAPGQLPGWIRGQEVAVLVPTKDEIGDNDVDVEWRVAEGEPEPPEKFEFRGRLRLEPDGKLVGDIEAYGENRMAHSIRSRKTDWDEDDWKRGSRRMVENRVPTVEVLDYEKYPRFPIEETARSVSFEAPGVAVRDGENWLIPLTILWLGWDDEFEDPPEERDLDVRFSHSYHEEEIVELELPEGYRLESLPKDMKAGAPPLEVSARFEAIPKGVRVRREIRVRHGVYDHEKHYARFRETIEALREIRTRTLVAVPARAE